MIARVFDASGLVIVGVFAILGFFVAVIQGALHKESGIRRGIEAAVLALAGGFIARGFISALLASANDSPDAGLAIGWGFFLVPGIVDTFARIPGVMDATARQALTAPGVLLTLAAIVGAFVGMMGGIYEVYDWLGLGWLAFPLDVTWALAGNTIGSVLHIVNLSGRTFARLAGSDWGEHGSEKRENAHRYVTGFGLRSSFAFTQGSVMSNLDEGPAENPQEEDAALYRHEKTHVWQNRAFGPLYTLSYLGWVVVWVVPAAIAGIIVKKKASGIFSGPNNWCYFNCPWETWAYAVQKVPRTDIIGVDPDDRKMIWPAKYVIAWSIPFFAIVTALALMTAISVWGQAPPATSRPDPNPRLHTEETSPSGRRVSVLFDFGNECSRLLACRETTQNANTVEHCAEA